MTRPSLAELLRSFLIAVIAVAPAQGSAQLAPIEEGRLRGVPIAIETSKSFKIDRSVFVSMRDGVRLSTDIYTPMDAKLPLPVIMIRTPYSKAQQSVVDIAARFARLGFAAVVQDHRGRFESEGVFFPYSSSDGRDGYDTISWIVKQPWSNGKVGTFGCSYLGETQHMLARERHPNHAAAVAQAGSSYGGAGVRNFGFQRYGATELASGASWIYRNGSSVFYGPPAGVDRAQWFRRPAARFFATGPTLPPLQPPALATLPLVKLMEVLEAPPNEWVNWLSKPPGDDYWKRQGTIGNSDRFNVPTLHMNGWYDITPNSTLELFRLFRENADTPQARDHQYLIMNPERHCSFDVSSETIVGDRPLGDARLDVWSIYAAWFNHWLNGEKNGITDALPYVLSYAMGRNRWTQWDTWPPGGTQRIGLSLASDGSARSLQGDGRLIFSKDRRGKASDGFIYDPMTPVPSLGGSICCMGGQTKSGAVDQRPIEMRNDLLVYTSDVLPEGLEIAGPVTARLFLSSDARDTDIVARLTDVYPDGSSFNIQEGVLRLRYRDNLSRPILMKKDRIYEVSVDLESTHNYFARGHRIRLHISSSSFPRWDRNMNTGGRNYDEASGKIARVKIHHSRKFPSQLLLTVSK